MPKLPDNARQEIEEVLWETYANLTPVAIRVLTNAVYRHAHKRRFANSWQATLEQVVMTRKFDSTRRWVEVLVRRDSDDSPPHD